jgi:[acyl-carrier-protein] S-malonyltransferase
MNNSTFLFPAFVLKYHGKEVDIICNNNIDFNARLEEISGFAGIDLTGFDLNENNFMDNELKNQLITYLISCLYSDILKSKQILPQNITFLSMGIYSALYCAESITLEEGALLIKRIFEKLTSQISDKSFKMLAVTGFSKADIEKIFHFLKLDCEIVIKNNKHSFIITGLGEEINRFYEYAQLEGAMHLNLFPVSIPYHSRFLRIDDMEKKLFDGIDIKAPLYNLFSSIDQKFVETSQQIKSAILSNLISYIDWHKTKTTLIENGSNHFIECGPGDSLKRISKFIDGDYKVISLQNAI